MQQLMNVLPHERLIYFGDTARVPYGNKSAQTIVRYSIENTISLLEMNIKLLVVACNTASAFALPKLRQLFNIPIIGVIDPGAERAIGVTNNQRIAVLGTKGTIESGAYQKAIHKLAPHAHILPIACPLFVPLVEERWHDHPASRLIIQEYLSPIRQENIDTILLGCTHYPLLKSLIRQEMGEKISIVDSASTCANQVLKLLADKQQLSPFLEGHHQYYVSDDPEKFHILAKSLFDHSPLSVELLSNEHPLLI